MADPESVHAFLDALSDHFQRPEYIRFDPIAVPHGFDDPADQEIIGLFAALLAWGRRDTMLKKLEELCERMDFRPARFIRDFDLERDEPKLRGFKHRTFQPEDALHFCRNLSACVTRFGSIEATAAPNRNPVEAEVGIGSAIEALSSNILGSHPDTPRRLSKHLARPGTGSACKRLCMYFRWMTRPGPFDLGVWKSFDQSELVLPLDVHSGRQARALGLLERKQDDWRGAIELTRRCREFDASDPARYDFAFFGLGAYGVPSSLRATASSVFRVSPTER